MSEQPKRNGGGQQRGQQAVGQLAQQTGGEGEVRAVQKGGGLTENGQPAPSGAPGGQQETGAVTGQEGRQGEQLPAAHRQGRPWAGEGRQGRDQHIEERDEGADGEHGPGAVPDR